MRALAWDSFLSADLNQRYFARLGDMHRQRDRTGKFVVAAFGSGSALAGWALWTHSGLEWMWPAIRESRLSSQSPTHASNLARSAAADPRAR